MPDYNPWGTPIFPQGAAFGTGSPAETDQQPSGLHSLFTGAFGVLGDLAKRAIGNSQNALDTGEYNPKPVLESALLPMGTGAFAGVPLRGAELALGAGPIRSVPMDEASRLARATEQGFTRDAYRGEGAPISGDSFIEGHSGRYDPGFLGSGGIYSTNRPHLANDYAMLKAAKERAADEAPNVMPLKVKMDNPAVITGEEKRAISGLSREERDAWLRDVYARGHDGVIVKYGGGNSALRSSGYEEYVAPATSYRSRFAAFDPANLGKAGLLGGLAGLLGAPIFANPGENKQ